MIYPNIEKINEILWFMLTLKILLNYIFEYYK